MNIAETTLTNDADIRTPLLAWLRSLHPDSLTAKMLEEFKMPRPSARIDVALVNGEMAGFEIKSDRDTLYRLSSQVPAFSKLFDRVTLVTTNRHVALAKSKIPNWWGLVVFSESQGFKVLRAPRLNKHVDTPSLLFALSKNELLSVARLGGAKLQTATKKEEMVVRLNSSMTNSEVRGLAREVIKSRVAAH